MELEKSWLTEYDFLEGGFTLYFATNWILLALAVFLLIRIFRTQRYLFLKPSCLVSSYAIILAQFPLAVYSTYCERTFQEPWVFSLLIHSFVFTGLTLGTLLFRREAYTVWDRLLNLSDRSAQGGFGVIFSLGLLIFAFLSAYLYYVPPTASGLYAIFFTPELSTIVREESLKTLDSAWLRYLYSFLTYSLAPMLAVSLSQAGFTSWKEGRVFHAFWWLVGFGVVLITASLTGERARPVEILLVSFIAVLLRRGLPFRPFTVILGISAVLVPAALLSILREGESLTITNTFYYFWGIVMRSFRGPFEVATWHVQYVEEHGLWGVAGIPKLALLFGETPVMINNVVGLHVLGNGLETISAGTGYLYTQYACFGLWSLPLTLSQLLFLDVFVLVIAKVNLRILLPAAAASMVLCLGFIQSSYTTVLLSSGFGIVYLVATAISHFLTGRPIDRIYRDSAPNELAA